ncbi:MAG: class I SAM-dependent methyltransferase [Anaerolineales bacterium]
MDVYNLYMKDGTIQKLLEINKQFYQEFGMKFSETRGRIQPGVRSILDSLSGNEKILDLGCGNGNAAKYLSNHNFKGMYTGIELSPALIKIAKEMNQLPSHHFIQADIASDDWDDILQEKSIDVVIAFATLHHIPSNALRVQIIKKTRKLLKDNGLFFHSNWQFLNSPKLKARIQPWSSAGIDESTLEEGDYLMDWKMGGKGLRYVHHFDEGELNTLADETGFTVIESFLSDGYENRLGMYQEWKKKDEFQD